MEPNGRGRSTKRGEKITPCETGAVCTLVLVKQRPLVGTLNVLGTWGWVYGCVYIGTKLGLQVVLPLKNKHISIWTCKLQQNTNYGTGCGSSGLPERGSTPCGALLNVLYLHGLFSAYCVAFS